MNPDSTPKIGHADLVYSVFRSSQKIKKKHENLVHYRCVRSPIVDPLSFQSHTQPRTGLTAWPYLCWVTRQRHSDMTESLNYIFTDTRDFCCGTFCAAKLRNFVAQQSCATKVWCVISLITVCTVVQNCCNGRSKKYSIESIGNGTFGGAPSQKPFNGST